MTLAEPCIVSRSIIAWISNYIKYWIFFLFRSFCSAASDQSECLNLAPDDLHCQLFNFYLAEAVVVPLLGGRLSTYLNRDIRAKENA